MIYKADGIKHMFGIYNGVFYVTGYRRNYGRT